MIIEAPNFINSKYLIIDEKGWRLKEGAPEELKREFKEFMQLVNKENENV